MNAKSKLIFREWQKPEPILTLVGWRPQDQLVFAVEPTGEPKVLRLVRLVVSQKDLLPGSSGTSSATGLATPPTQTGHAEPEAGFPDAIPVSVTEVRLMPPPCRTNGAEAESLRQETGDLESDPTFPRSATAEAWELARLRYDPEVLVPSREDEPRLRDSLEQFLSNTRQEYEARKAELEELQLLAAHGLPIVGNTRYYDDLTTWPKDSLSLRLQQARLRLEWGFPRDCLRWTIEDARRHARIRNPVLRLRWAQANKLSLVDLTAQRLQFLRTLPALRTAKDTLAAMGIEIGPSVMARLFNHPACYDPARDTADAFGEAETEQLLYCATVRYLVRSATKPQAGSAAVPSGRLRTRVTPGVSCPRRGPRHRGPAFSRSRDYCACRELGSRNEAG
jgi:hypothetical protein